MSLHSDTVFSIVSYLKSHEVSLQQIAQMYRKGQTIICDLDGTLCQVDHRLHLAKDKKWDEFNRSCVLDPPWKDTLEVLKGLKLLGHTFAFVTGREESHRQGTIQWLAQYEVWDPSVLLLMRAVGDYRSDVEVKRDLYKDHLKDRSILFAMEDRDGVTELWRSLGIRCFQVQEEY